MSVRQVVLQEITPVAHADRPRRHSLKQWISAALFVVSVAFLGTVVLPAFLGDRTLVIISGSMEPAIHVGAAVILQPVASHDLQVGDVVAYTPNAKGAIPIAHRIVKISARNSVRYYQTRGDANPTADANEFTLPATTWRMWYTIPLAGYVIAFASSRLGTVLLVAVPVALLIVMKVADWRKKRRFLQQPQPVHKL